MNVEVTVGEVDFNTVIRSAYPDDVYSGPYESTLGQVVASILATRLVKDRPEEYNTLLRQITSIRDEEIRALITPLIAEGIEGSFQRTTNYGEPHGPQVTMRQIIMDEVKKALTVPVGNPTNYGGNVKDTLVQKLIKDAVAAEFAKVVAEAIKDVRAEIAAIAGDSAKAAVMAALKK